MIFIDIVLIKSLITFDVLLQIIQISFFRKITGWTGIFRCMSYTTDTVHISANPDSVVIEGHTKEITCVVQANPDPNITLYRKEGTRKVKMGDSSHNRLSQSINITRDIRHHYFICRATSSNSGPFITNKSQKKLILPYIMYDLTDFA